MTLWLLPAPGAASSPPMVMSAGGWGDGEGGAKGGEAAGKSLESLESWLQPSPSSSAEPAPKWGVLGSPQTLCQGARGRKRLCCLEGARRSREAPRRGRGWLRDPSPGYFGGCRSQRCCGELCTACPSWGWNWGQGWGEQTPLRCCHSPRSCPELRSELEPRGCARSGTLPQWPPSPVPPRVQPGGRQLSFPVRRPRSTGSRGRFLLPITRCRLRPPH